MSSTDTGRPVGRVVFDPLLMVITVSHGSPKRFKTRLMVLG